MTREELRNSLIVLTKGNQKIDNNTDFTNEQVDEMIYGKKADAILSLLDAHIKEMLEDVIGSNVTKENHTPYSWVVRESWNELMEEQRQRASKYLPPANQRKE